MGLRWWDRDRKEGNLRNYVGPSNKNMNLDTYPFPKTIYERINDEYSSTYQCYMNRGASSNVQLKWMAVVTKYAHYFPLGPLKYIIQHIPYFGKMILPNEMMGEEEVVDNAISDLLKFHPRVQWITFGTPDGYRHSFGEEEEDYYRSIIRACDQQIGRYRKKCEEIGGEEGKRLIVVTSDHSIVNLQHHVNLEDILKGIKLKVEYGSCASVISSSLTKPISDYENSDGAIAVNGNTLLHVYFRDPIDRNSEENNFGWKTRKNCSLLSSYQRLSDDQPINIIDEIRFSEGIELVICLQDLTNHSSSSSFDQSQKEVHIYSKTGHSIIRKDENNIKNDNKNYQNEEEKLKYIVNEGEKDALGWFDAVDKIEISHTADEWLNLTADWEFPYATVRLWRSINANSSGDLIITSLDKWDMAKEGYEIIIGQHKGGHGGLRKDQMLVPAIFSVASSSPSSPTSSSPSSSSSSSSSFSSSSSKQLLKKNYKVKYARAEDVGATLMSLVGVFDEELLLANFSSNSPLDENILENFKYANPRAIRGSVLSVHHDEL